MSKKNPFRFSLQCFNTESPEAWRGLISKTEDLGYDEPPLYARPVLESLGHVQLQTGAWDEAVASHRAWLERLSELAPAAVRSVRPVIAAGPGMIIVSIIQVPVP